MLTFEEDLCMKLPASTHGQDPNDARTHLMVVVVVVNEGGEEHPPPAELLGGVAVVHVVAPQADADLQICKVGTGWGNTSELQVNSCLVYCRVFPIVPGLVEIWQNGHSSFAAWQQWRNAQFFVNKR